MVLIMTGWGVILKKFTRLYNHLQSCCFAFNIQGKSMRTATYILFFLFFGSSLYGQQFYIRGEVKDESGNPLQNVNILLHATGYVYHTGTYGWMDIKQKRRLSMLIITLPCE